MNGFLRRNWAFLLLTLCAIGVAAGILVGRAKVEQDNRTYDIVLDYADLETMASQSDQSIDQWLELFYDQGVRSVALMEDTLTSLSQLPGSGVSYAKVSTIQGMLNWREQYPQQLVELISASQSPYDLLVSVSDSDLFQWILRAFENRTDHLDAVTFCIDGTNYLWINGTYRYSGSNWVEFPLGLLPQRVELLQSHGFSIIPRTSTRAYLNDAKFAEAVLEEFAQYQPAYFMNSGDGLLGFEEPEQARELLLDYLDTTGAVMAVTEEMDQSQNVTWSGFDSFITDDLDSVAVRVFNEYGYIQNRWQYYGYSGPEEIVNSLFRAVVERNCRIIYLKMILKTDDEEVYITDPAAYEELLSSLFIRLEDAGLTFGTAKALTHYEPAWYWHLFIGLGCIGGALVLLDLMIKLRLRWRLLLLALGWLAVAGCFYVAPNGVKLLLSMGAAVLFPCLAGLGAYRLTQRGRWKEHSSFGRIFLRCVGLVIFCGVIVLCGALTAASALSESAYMLEMKLYRGVKLMQLVPIAFLAAMFLLLFTVEDFGGREPMLAWGRGFAAHWREPGWRKAQKEGWNCFMDSKVSVRAIVVIGVSVVMLAGVGVVGIYYLSRTGNTTASTQVSTIELRFRNLLEYYLIARPRTKEFLIGWPCLTLMIYALHHRSRLFAFLFSLGASIGLTSVVNTFQHIRTPLQLSLLRTFYGLAFGLILGLAAVIVLELLRKLFTRRQADA